jgi:hypothetical protein
MWFRDTVPGLQNLLTTISPRAGGRQTTVFGRTPKNIEKGINNIIAKMLSSLQLAEKQ